MSTEQMFGGPAHGERRPVFGPVRVVTDEGVTELPWAKIEVVDVLYGVGGLDDGGWAEQVILSEPADADNPMAEFVEFGRWVVGPDRGPVVSIEHTAPNEQVTAEGHRVILQPLLVIDDRTPKARVLAELSEVAEQLAECKRARERLVRAAEAEGASQHEIAARARMSQPTVHRMLTRKPRRP